MTQTTHTPGIDSVQPGIPARAGSLYRRQAIALIAMFALTGLIFVLLGWLLARQHLDVSSQQLNRDLAVRLVADNALVSRTSGRIDETAVKRTFEHYMHVNPAIEIYLLDADGNIRAFSADPGQVKRKQVAIAPVEAFIENTRALPILGDDPRGSDRRKVFSASRLAAERPELGYLYVVLRGQAQDLADEAFGDSYLFKALIVALAASLALGLAVSLIVFRLLGRRLERLSDRISLFGAAINPDSGADGEATSRDELALLEASFDNMAARIRGQIDTLAETDRKRREFIAHISHDLRTPLTLVNANLESLSVRFDRLNEAERHEHLQAARHEGERLNRLVDDLFQLARLDNAVVDFNRHPLSVTDLIQDVTHKHAINSDVAGVTINADVPDKLPLIDGDVGLLERLLDNLLINAIDHTPTGGDVLVSAATEDDRVLITVSDTGSGIPPEAAEQIFEPGYRADDEHGAGAGLGLAIARRISKWHGGTLTVANNTNRGASFELRLPLTDTAG